MKKGYLFILIATIAFSSMEVVLKFIAGEVNSGPADPVPAFPSALCFLAPVAVYTLKKRGKRLDRKSVAYFALLGLVGIAICMPILSAVRQLIPTPPWWRSCSAATRSLSPFWPSCS